MRCMSTTSPVAAARCAARISDLPCALDAIGAMGIAAAARALVVFLDYDGTLTPIVSQPEDAILAPEMRTAVENLATRCPVAIVSGRDLKDVQARVGVAGLYYAGSHGFEIAGPAHLLAEYEPAQAYLPALDAAESTLEHLLGTIPGARVERKRFSIAVHYRNVEAGRAGAVEDSVDRTLERHAGLRKGRGKRVFELQPAVDWNKGRALAWLLEQLQLEHSTALPLYIGDDLTDEDAFRALEAGGIGIVVGHGDRTTAAHYRLRDPEQVQRFLQRLAELLAAPARRSPRAR